MEGGQIGPVVVLAIFLGLIPASSTIRVVEYEGSMAKVLTTETSINYYSYLSILFLTNNRIKRNQWIVKLLGLHLLI